MSNLGCPTGVVKPVNLSPIRRFMPGASLEDVGPHTLDTPSKMNSLEESAGTGREL
jgi:hypothetical protein